MPKLWLIVKQKYHGLRLQKKLFFFIGLITSISILLSLIVIHFGYRSLRHQHYETAAKFLNLSAASIGRDLEQAKHLALQIATDAQIQKRLKLLGQNPSLIYSDIRHDTEAILERYNVLEEYIDSLSLLNINGGEIIVGKRRLPLSSSQKTDFLELAKAADGRTVWLPDENGKWLFCIRAARQIEPFNLATLGTTILRINTEALLHKYSHLFNETPENILILHDNQTIFSSKTGPEFSLSLDMSQLASSGYFSQPYQNKLYFVAYQKVPYTNFIYISLIADSLISRQFNLLYIVVILLFLLILALSFWVSHRFSKEFTRPISELSENMRAVENNYFDFPQSSTVDCPSENELEHLQRDFNGMMNRIHHLIQENYIKQLSLQDSKYRILQSQVNPHFLYNTLTSINSLAKISDQTEISLMVESLAKLLRSSLNNNENLNTLKAEIDILNSYLQIEKIRYGSRLEVIISIPETLMEYRIPLFTLQPLVQNSVKYTLEYRRGPAQINVSARIDESQLILTVTDNGIGMTSDEVEKLQANQVNPKGLGIGIKNIHERIQILCGPPYGLHFESEKDMGTTVTVHLPKDSDTYISPVTKDPLP